MKRKIVSAAIITTALSGCAELGVQSDRDAATAHCKKAFKGYDPIRAGVPRFDYDAQFAACVAQEESRLQAIRDETPQAARKRAAQRGAADDASQIYLQQYILQKSFAPSPVTPATPYVVAGHGR